MFNWIYSPLYLISQFLGWIKSPRQSVLFPQIFISNSIDKYVAIKLFKWPKPPLRKTMSKKCLNRTDDKTQPARIRSSLVHLWPWHDHGVHCLQITSLSRVWWRALPKCCSFACNCVQCKVCRVCSVLKVECSSGCSSLLHLQSWSALSHIQAFQNISHEFPMNFHSEMVIKYFPSKIWVLTFSENVFANWIALAGFSYAPLDVWQLQKVHHTEYIIISTDWSAQRKVFFKKFLQWNELQLRDRVLLLSRGAPTSLSPQLNWHSPKKIECRKN